MAAGFLALIFFVGRHKPPTASGPARVLPELEPEAVASIQVRPAAYALGIRAERTNGGWRLTQPISYPAQSVKVDKLVAALESLVSATFIAPAELHQHHNPDEEYGFAAPQASIVIQQGNSRTTVLIGAMTAPGDQVFVQVVGREGVYVTDAGWLSCVPKSADEWRDTSVLPAGIDTFDRLAVTNSSRAFVLQREPNRLWRMVWPLNSARADNARIHDALSRLERLRIRQFVSDDPKTDLDSLGLAPPSLELSLGSGTNILVVLQVGKTVPTATNEVYARRLGSSTFFTVDNEPLSAWRSASVNDFRDPHLLTPSQPILAVDVRGEETFSLQLQTNQTWRILPQDFPADSGLVEGFLKSLTNLPILEFTKDVVNPPDLPQFGLASPTRRYIVKTGPGTTASSSAKCVTTELNFGIVTNQPGKVFVWRPDESSVYAIASNDFARLPSKSWQLRDRKFWNFTVDDVVGVTITHRGKTRELIRASKRRWSFAPGSQGIINDLAVEETVRGLAQTAAVAWVAHGEQARRAFGQPETAYQVTIHLKNGNKATLEFGAEAPSTNRYAGIQLDGQYWVFEFSWILFRDVSSYLGIP